MPFFNREAVEAQSQEQLNSLLAVQQHLQNQQHLLASTLNPAVAAAAATTLASSSNSAHTPIVPLQSSSSRNTAAAATSVGKVSSSCSSSPSCNANSVHRSPASAREESPAVRSTHHGRITETNCRSVEASLTAAANKRSRHNCCVSSSTTQVKQDNQSITGAIESCEEDSDCSSHDVDIEGSGNVDIVGTCEENNSNITNSLTQNKSHNDVSTATLSSSSQFPPPHPEMQSASGGPSHRLAGIADPCPQSASLGGACSNNSTSSVSTEPANDEMFESLGLYIINFLSTVLSPFPFNELHFSC